MKLKKEKIIRREIRRCMVIATEYYRNQIFIEDEEYIKITKIQDILGEVLFKYYDVKKLIKVSESILDIFVMGAHYDDKNKVNLYGNMDEHLRSIDENILSGFEYKGDKIHCINISIPIN